MDRPKRSTRNQNPVYNGASRQSSTNSASSDNDCYVSKEKELSNGPSIPAASSVELQSTNKRKLSSRGNKEIGGNKKQKSSKNMADENGNFIENISRTVLLPVIKTRTTAQIMKKVDESDSSKENMSSPEPSPYREMTPTKHEKSSQLAPIHATVPDDKSEHYLKEMEDNYDYDRLVVSQNETIDKGDSKIPELLVQLTEETAIIATSTTVINDIGETDHATNCVDHVSFETPPPESSNTCHHQSTSSTFASDNTAATIRYYLEEQQASWINWTFLQRQKQETEIQLKLKQKSKEKYHVRVLPEILRYYEILESRSESLINNETN